MAEYPDRLIPKPGYSIVAGEDLNRQSGLCLIRHIESSQTRFLPRTGTLDPDCIQIQSNHLKDLSTNLLGVFRIGDVSIGIVKDFTEIYHCLWDGKSVCKIPDESHFFIDEGRGFYFIPVDPLLSSDIKKVNLETRNEDHYHFRILHTPTVSNYWHVSIRVYDSDNNEISTLPISDSRKNKIWKTVKQYLVTRIVTIDNPDFNHLDPSFYICSSTRPQTQD